MFTPTQRPVFECSVFHEMSVFLCLLSRLYMEHTNYKIELTNDLSRLWRERKWIRAAIPHRQHTMACALLSTAVLSGSLARVPEKWARDVFRCENERQETVFTMVTAPTSIFMKSEFSENCGSTLPCISEYISLTASRLKTRQNTANSRYVPTIINHLPWTPLLYVLKKKQQKPHYGRNLETATVCVKPTFSFKLP